MTKHITPILLLITIALACAAACAAPPEHPPTPLVVFGAGSLIHPFNALETAFEAANPDIDVRNEYHGSIQVIRHVTEIGTPVDVAASADHALIPLLMYGSTLPDSDQPYADWYLQFASNEVVLAYTAESQYAAEVSADNWTGILARPGVRFGLSDPRFDALGYRSLMILKMAESHYDRPGVFQHLVTERFSTPISAYWEDGLTEITVPEIVDPIPDSGVLMRGSSIQIVALLEGGEVDYTFLYRSVALQNGFEMVELPDALNLGSASLNEEYGSVTVRVDFRRFASVEPVFKGERIGYGITIPANAPHAEAAERYLAFLLSEAGRAIMEANHHPMFDPALASHYEALPETLKPLVEAQP